MSSMYDLTLSGFLFLICQLTWQHLNSPQWLTTVLFSRWPLLSARTPMPVLSSSTGTKSGLDPSSRMKIPLSTILQANNNQMVAVSYPEDRHRNVRYSPQISDILSFWLAKASDLLTHSKNHLPK